jgi:hypothetical protein
MLTRGCSRFSFASADAEMLVFGTILFSSNRVNGDQSDRSRRKAWY